MQGTVPCCRSLPEAIPARIPELFLNSHGSFIYCHISCHFSSLSSSGFVDFLHSFLMST